MSENLEFSDQWLRKEVKFHLKRTGDSIYSYSCKIKMVISVLSQWLSERKWLSSNSVAVILESIGKVGGVSDYDLVASKRSDVQPDYWLRGLVRDRMTELGVTPYRIEKDHKIAATIVKNWIDGKRKFIRSDTLFRIINCLQIDLEA